jgi:hypothetical protein
MTRSREKTLAKPPHKGTQRASARVRRRIGLVAYHVGMASRCRVMWEVGPGDPVFAARRRVGLFDVCRSSS